MTSVKFYVPVFVEVTGDDGALSYEELLAKALSLAPNLYQQGVMQKMEVTPKITVTFCSEYETAIVRRYEDDDGLDYENRGGQWRRM